MAGTETFYKMGFRMPWTEELEHARGMVSPMEIGDQGNGVRFMACTYFAFPAEELKAMSCGGKMSEEDSQKLFDGMAVLLTVIAIDGGQGIKEIKEKMGMGEVPEDSFTEVGRYKDTTYYAVTDRPTEEAFVKTQDPVYAEDFRNLQAAWIKALKEAEYFEPRIPGAELVGKTIRFETKDIDGAPVKSEELFAAHKVTMINIWATWCGPCRKELEELGHMHRRLEKKDAAVVGICDDAAAKTAECKELIKEKGLSYLNLLPYEGMEELEIDAFPTSFFVDREGKVLTSPVIGVPADISEYEKTIDSLLNGAETLNDPVPAAGDQKEYRILVKDEAGSPAADVRLQFCDDVTCMFGKTDGEGSVTFRAAPGKYTVHVQAVPEGYVLSTEEFPVTEDAEEAEIILKKA